MKSLDNHILKDLSGDHDLLIQEAEKAIISNGLALNGDKFTGRMIKPIKAQNSYVSKVFLNIVNEVHPKFFIFDSKTNLAKKLKIISEIPTFKLFKTTDVNNLVQLFGEMEPNPEIEKEIEKKIESGEQTPTNVGNKVFEPTSVKIKPDKYLFDQMDYADKVNKDMSIKSMTEYYNNINNTSMILDFIDVHGGGLFNILNLDKQAFEKQVGDICFQLAINFVENNMMYHRNLDAELKYVEEYLKYENLVGEDAFKDAFSNNTIIHEFLALIQETIEVYVGSFMYTSLFEKICKEKNVDVETLKFVENEYTILTGLIGYVEVESKNFDTKNIDEKLIPKAKEEYIKLLCSRLNITEDQYGKEIKKIQDHNKVGAESGTENTNNEENNTEPQQTT